MGGGPFRYPLLGYTGDGQHPGIHKLIEQGCTSANVAGNRQGYVVEQQAG